MVDNRKTKIILYCNSSDQESGTLTADLKQQSISKQPLVKFIGASSVASQNQTSTVFETRNASAEKDSSHYKVSIDRDDHISQSRNQNQQNIYQPRSNYRMTNVRQTDLNPLFLRMRANRFCCCLAMRTGINIVGIFIFLQIAFVVVQSYI